MIVKIKTDELLPCLCGGKPTYYEIAYGRTPYIVFCPDCKKRNWRGIGGSTMNIINEWNKNVRLKTKEDLSKESIRFDKKNG